MLKREDRAVDPVKDRHPGPSVAEIFATDTWPVSPFLEREVYRYLGSDPLDTRRYTSQAFFDLELEKLWPRVWQLAAREEDMPNPGDFVVYDNAGRSYALMRQADGEVRAFHNVCLHRGRKLKTASGRANEFRCPYHGFTWNADGSFRDMPCAWDFKHLNRSELNLPEASVGRWGGYIFVREAADGPSLEDFLSPLQDYLAPYRHEDRVTVAWVGKVIRANWKATQEAFMESYHVYATHPQILPYTADANSRYNIYGDNVNLAVTLNALRSPHLDPVDNPEEAILRAQERMARRANDETSRRRPAAAGFAQGQSLPPGKTARAITGDAGRKMLTEAYGDDYSQVSDSEVQDIFTCHVFPNIAPWGGYRPNILFRWRPWPDQNATLMEVRFLAPVAKGAERPRAPAMRMLAETDAWASAAELGGLGEVIDQDEANLVYVQEGLHASKSQKVNLGNYQEIRIRQFQQTIDKYLSS